MDAQENFGAYMNKIFFNVFTFNPDSSLRKFLNDYVPDLLNPPELGGSWTVYPTKEVPVPTVITHSYFFKQHPFIETNIVQGEFKVYTSVYDNEIYHSAINIRDIQVIMEFEQLGEANKLFQILRNDLTALGKEHTFYEDKFRKSSKIYSEETEYNVPSGVRIQLLVERGFDNFYQLSIGID